MCHRISRDNSLHTFPSPLCSIIPAFRGWSPNIGTKMPVNCLLLILKCWIITRFASQSRFLCASHSSVRDECNYSVVTKEIILRQPRWKVQIRKGYLRFLRNLWLEIQYHLGTTFANASSGFSYFQMNVMSGNRPIAVEIDFLSVCGKSTDFATEPNEIKTAFGRSSRIELQLWNCLWYFSSSHEGTTDFIEWLRLLCPYSGNIDDTAERRSGIINQRFRVRKRVRSVRWDFLRYPSIIWREEIPNLERGEVSSEFFAVEFLDLKNNVDLNDNWWNDILGFFSDKNNSALSSLHRYSSVYSTSNVYQSEA